MEELFWNGAYIEREKISFISGFVLIALSFLILIKPIKTLQATPSTEMTAFVAYEEQVQASLPEPIVQPVVKALPQVVTKPVLKTTPVPEKTLPSNEPVHRSEVTETPLQRSQEAETTAKPTAETKPVASPVSQAKTEPGKAEAPPASVSAKYESYVLAYLEKAKRYPTSREARQSRPQGTVKIWLEINRAGELVNYGLTQTSGSNLLDNEALKIAKFGEFPPFPEGVYANESTHRFVASLKYEVN